MRDAPLVIACDVPAARSLADALAGKLVAIPSASEALERWRERELAGPTRNSVAVAPWAEALDPSALLGTPADGWLARAEELIARWLFALGYQFGS